MLVRLRRYRWRLVLSALGIGLPFLALWLVNLREQTGGQWPLPVVVVVGAFYAIVTLPGLFYALHGWRTMAVICAYWAIVGFAVGWVFDHKGIPLWRNRRARRTTP